MKHKNYFLIIMALSIFFISCSKDKSSRELTGSWDWVKSVGGIAGSTQTPASTGIFIKLDITSDNRYSLFTNGVLTSSGTFTLITQNCIHDHSNKEVIDFSDPAVTDLMIESIGSNNLSLSDEFNDGWMIEYQRN